MLNLFLRCLLAGMFFVGTTAFAQTEPTSSPATTTASDDDAAQQLSWPRTIQDATGTIVIYQPQVETWSGDKLEARAAVALTPLGKAEPTFGVMWVTARTDVDKPNRIVTLDNFQVTKVIFPQDKAREPEYLANLRSHVADGVREVPLDHLEANLAATEAAAAEQNIPVQNNPPKIIFAKSPALLVLIDGEPALRQVEGQKMMRVVNTRAMILLDQTANRYYVHAMSRWFTSTAVTGPWAPATVVPLGMDGIADSLSKSGTIDLLNPEDPDAAPKEIPTIYSSTTPAELIQMQGDAEYTPIAGTNLLYAKNTDSAVFMQVTTQQLYVLISGRWFRSASMEGPWTYVAGKDLPPDFAKIPPDSPKANVLVSVPGTAEAKEAVIADSIPQTASVSIADTHLTVDYDGAANFKPIEATSGLSYAVNTPLPVIRVDAAQTYWCVQNGVWFQAYAPTGPWVVATAVPPSIYSIPPSSPVYYVTYVRIYSYTPTVVYVGYTPGYMGTCISGGVVVYGTGYYYPAYVGTVWVGYPPTYGYGASFACGVATGFAFGFAAGAIMGNCWSRPYWGPCRGYGYAHIDINTSSVYRNWRGGVTGVNSHFEYNSAAGKIGVSQRGATFNPYSGRASVGGYSKYANASSGDYQFQRGGATYNQNTGVVKGGGVRNSGNMYDGDNQTDSARFRYNTNTNSGVGRVNDDVYASKDGNVYKYSKDSGWQQRSDGSWQAADKPTGNGSFSQQRQNLDADRSSRDLGQQRFNNLQSSGGGYRRSGGGGGGGGGFRGRR